MTIGPLRPLKPFMVGFGGPNHATLSLESSQHIYNFLPEDLTWSDNDNNMYLSPVIASQQVLDPSAQTSHPRKEKRGKGAHLLQQSLQESKSQGLGIYVYLLRMFGKVFYLLFYSI